MSAALAATDLPRHSVSIPAPLSNKRLRAFLLLSSASSGSMKNILLVGNWPSDTGYAWWLMETFWLAISRKYHNERRVIVCYPTVTTVSQRLVAENIEIVEFDFADPNPLRLFSFLKHHRIDCVYLTDKSYMSWRYLLLRTAGVRWVVLHDHSPGLRTVPAGFKRLLKRFIGRISVFTADAYIAVSDQVFRRLIEVACLPRRRCYLARNGIDVGRIVNAPCGRIRLELNIPAEAILVVSCGRMTQFKSIQTIIEGADILVNRQGMRHMVFVHCGDGPERGVLTKLIETLELQRNVFLVGMRDDVPSILKSADIAVHPSQGEGLSLSILEFMCAGLPVLVSDDPTVSQAVTHDLTGLLFRIGSAEDLALKLAYLAQSKSVRTFLGQNAAAEVSRNYTLDGTVSALLCVFEQLMPLATVRENGNRCAP